MGYATVTGELTEISYHPVPYMYHLYIHRTKYAYSGEQIKYIFCRYMCHFCTTGPKCAYFGSLHVLHVST